MKNIIIMIGICILASFWGNSAFARTIYYGNTTETVTIEHKEPVILRFPTNVKSVSKTNEFQITPAEKDNPDYSRIKVISHFRKVKRNIQFELDNGDIVKTLLVVVQKGLPSKTDYIYDFEPRENERESRSKNLNIAEIDFMKSMIRDDFILGAKVSKVNKRIFNKNKWLKANLVKVFTHEKFNGHVIKLLNKSYKKDVIIDLSKIKVGKNNLAILAQVDKKVLPPRKSTTLRILSKPSSVYRYITLPFEMKEVKNESK